MEYLEDLKYKFLNLANLLPPHFQFMVLYVSLEIMLIPPT